MNIFNLGTATRLLLFIFLLIASLFYARAFLIPISLAAVLAMLFAPLSGWLEERRIPGFVAAIICVLIFLAAAAGVIGLVSWQVSDFAKDADQMKQELRSIVSNVEQFISSKLGIPVKQQEKSLSGMSDIGSMAMSTASSVFSLLVDWVLLVVYMLLILYLRHHIRRFILKIVPDESRDKAGKIMSESGAVAKQYLTGLAKMIVALWVMYGIAFSIIGVKSALFFAVLCGLLEIVPFLGSLTGCTLTALMVVAQGGDAGMLTGVVISYGTIQLFQSYVLEPLMVGSTVNLNALFTIMSLVAGEMVWGVPGMILAIPLVGIFKIICDHVEPLKPYGYLIGETRQSRKPLPAVEWIKDKWQGWKK